MAVRTTETTVTFTHPFVLSSVEGPLPAGSYRLVTDEEEIPGLSFLAFRHAATMLHLPALSSPDLTRQVVPVDRTELAAVLAADGAGAAEPR
jgi:hypothetical protein